MQSITFLQNYAGVPLHSSEILEQFLSVFKWFQVNSDEKRFHFYFLLAFNCTFDFFVKFLHGILGECKW